MEQHNSFCDCPQCHVTRTEINNSVAPGISMPTQPAMSDYLLTIRVRYPALDDVAGRQDALKALAGLGIDKPRTGIETKLQKLVPGAPPVPVSLELDPPKPVETTYAVGLG